MPKIVEEMILVGGEPSKASTVNVLLRDIAGNALVATGTTIPALGAKGYAKGCLFMDTDASAGATLLYNNGSETSCAFALEYQTKAIVALSDAAATLTAAQLVGSGLFTITPTAGRALTLDTAANIVAGMQGAIVGAWFDFSVVCLAAFAATITTATGLTLVGNMAVNNQSATFRALVTNVGTPAVTILRLTA